MTLGARLVYAFGWLLLLACSAHPQREPMPTLPAPVRPATSPTSGEQSPPPSQLAGHQPSALTTRVAILDERELTALEGAGYALGHLVADIQAQSTLELDQHRGFHDIFAVLRGDIQETKQRFPLARPTSMLGFRQFDQKWLSSSEMSFALVGIFNRLDRRVFYPGTCGELRFVYRLRYETLQGGRPMRGYLPMTVNLVFMVGEGTEDDEHPCAQAAKAWQHRPELAGAGLVNWLTGAGPLGHEQRRRWTMKSLETNLQTIRLQSTVHTTLAGHIEYSLHVFQPRNEARTAFSEARLENMPDVNKLTADRALRNSLLALLKEPRVLADIDRGTLQLPERFLARRAVSFSPRGLTRLHNRPFRRLFNESDFEDLDLSAYQTIRSTKALLRRLDGASCTGCHQSRSIAGFHHIGTRVRDEPVGPTLLEGSSQHLQADLERRRAYVARLALGEAPDEFRPVPERQGAAQGFGAPCGLGDPGFSDWLCDSGLSCYKLEDEDVGACLPAAGTGMPCEHGVMQPGSSPHHDRVSNAKHYACGESLSCDRNIQGFPLGACAAHCDNVGPGGVCGRFLDVDGYQQCLRSKLPNAECAKRFVFETGLRQCDGVRRCRQDYVCVRTGTDGVGACVPPYFVYDLRNDGYPLQH